MPPVYKNQNLHLLVDNLTPEGMGVARQDGFAVFIHNALPGERVLARVERVERSYAYARTLEIVEPSPMREQPLCPYFARCGGCDLLHISYPMQLESKRRNVEDCFRRIAHIEVSANPAIGMNRPWHYRNKCAYPVGGAAREPLIGFFRPRTHDIVDIEDCPIQAHQSITAQHILREFLETHDLAPYNERSDRGELRHLLTRVNKHGEAMVVLVTRHDHVPLLETLAATFVAGMPEAVTVVQNVQDKRSNVILGERSHVHYGSGYIQDELCGLRFKVSVPSFFQINRRQAEVLYETALDMADIREDSEVLDLYCGTGTLTLLAARRAKKAVGIENVAAAIHDAQENAAANGIGNADFLWGNVEDVLPARMRGGYAPDVILLDPPRKGCDKKVLDAVLHAGPRRLVYVSCDPATLARDVALLARGGYRPSIVQPVDMFCHTKHVETAVLLTRIDE